MVVDVRMVYAREQLTGIIQYTVWHGYLKAKVIAVILDRLIFY